MAAPPSRKTIEVDISWLEEALDAKKKNAPPPLPEPAPASEPEPPRRNTIEVQMEWLEIVDEEKKKDDPST